MIFNFFKNNSFKKGLDFYNQLNQDIKKSQNRWLALTVNTNSYEESHLTKEVIVTFNDPEFKSKQSIVLAEKPTGLFQLILKDDKPYVSSLLHNKNESTNIRETFNYFFEHSLESELKHFKQELISGDINQSQIDVEERALEWMKVSFELLEKAIILSLTNTDYLFQLTFFSGTNPQSGLHEMRLIIFNLDISLILLKDKNLRITIYNKKNEDQFDYTKPVIKGDYSIRKKESFDQFITLLALCSKGIHA